MTDAPANLPAFRTGERRAGRLTRLLASRRFQRWATLFPLTRGIVRREGAALFDLVAGFCHSQILMAFTALDLPERLMERESTVEALSTWASVPPERMKVLIAGAEALGLVRKRRTGVYRLTRRGAALAGVPGLKGMIAHHDVLYRDLADPVAFFRGETETELAGFWPYVFGAGGAGDPKVAAAYSRLMSDSQVLVAEDTLASVDFTGVKRLVDVGGGTGMFLSHVADAYPQIALTLFDLPAVAAGARDRFAASCHAKRLEIVSGSFRDDPLPEGADAISLVRVLYDHEDATVQALLSKVAGALPKGGRLIVSEPMAGSRAGDAYFALYCMAMRTGKARTATEISTLMAEAGFTGIKAHRPARSFVTSVIEGVRES